MRGKLIPFTEEDKKIIIERYVAGEGASVIAKDYQCANVRVNDVLREAGLRVKGDPFTDAHKRDIAERYEAGEDVSAIARRYRCRYYTMRDLIKTLDVKPRVITTADTPIERRLQDVLKKRGIGFATQVRLVDRFIVDIKVNQANIIIEADGKTYHYLSERDVERDRKHEAAGYRIFRFTGSEINSDAEACIQRVVDECGLTPDEEPVYEIRTKFIGENHPRWNRYSLKCLNCDADFDVVGKNRHRKFCQLACYHRYVRKTGIFKGGRATIERPD